MSGQENIEIIINKPSKDYELIDSGDGWKFERFGKYKLVRPDPQALWRPNLSKTEWSKANGRFENQKEQGVWKFESSVPQEWTISVSDLKFLIKPSKFKHIGIFPEQIEQWSWIRNMIKGAKRPISVLNLFAYTGGASLSCAKEGASVCHVDSSKVAVNWAKENLKLSGLKEDSIRWIVDDVLVFVKREIKRGAKYDAVIMDPPSFGRGVNGEIWKIEEDCAKLVELIPQLLSDKPLFVILNGYASGYSAIAYEQLLKGVFQKAFIEKYELSISDISGRLLPAGICSRAVFLVKN